MSNIELYLWLFAAASLAVATLCYYRHHQSRRLLRIFKALAESESQPMLIYNERGQLIYQSAGLVVFDTKALHPFRTRPEPALRGQESQGELTIDGNRYRYRTQLCEYRAGATVTVMYLSYQGAEPYKK